MKEFALLLGVLVLWIGLNRWVLPWFGIRTCMSGGCATSCCPSRDGDPWKQSDKDVLESTDDQK